MSAIFPARIVEQGPEADETLRVVAKLATSLIPLQADEYEVYLATPAVEVGTGVEFMGKQLDRFYPTWRNYIALG